MTASLALALARLGTSIDPRSLGSLGISFGSWALFFIVGIPAWGIAIYTVHLWFGHREARRAAARSQGSAPLHGEEG